MSARNHEDYQENIAAYVLGALPELDAELLERHLAGCETCRAEAEDLRLVTAAMARSVPQVEPPPSLKASLMRTVTEEAALRAAQRPGPRETRRRQFEGWTPQLAVGLAALVLAVVVAVGIATDPFAGGGSTTTTITAQIDRKLMPTGTAVLHVSGSDGRLELKNAPAPPPGRVYQLWFQHGKTIERGGTFKPKRDGSYDATVSVAGARAVMVTVEKAGGASAPTGPPVMQFTV